jgi:CheY-like chemotaxis protein
MNFLLVDDEVFALQLLTHQLARLGFTDVLGIEDPVAAVAMLEVNPQFVDMILLDLQMPTIDGVEFVRHLARLQYAGGLILVSGEDDRILQTAERLAKAQGLDVRGALHKPVTPDQLKGLLGAPAPKVVRTPQRTYSAERLAQAIADGEITSYYQPQIRLATGEVDGVESLARWVHPEDGLVMPMQFIGVA